MQYFIDGAYSPFALQVVQFGSQLTNALATLLGFSTAEQAAAVADGEYMTWEVACDKIAEDYAHQWKHSMHIVRYGDPLNPLVTAPSPPSPPVFPAAPTTIVDLRIQDRYAKNAAKAKASVNYTTDIGKKLGIEGVQTAFDPTKGKPKVEVVLTGGFPVIHFIKGHYHAANLYKDTGSGFGTTPFITLINSHYRDTTPLPAPGVSMLIKYKMKYLWHNIEEGFDSDIVSITVTG